MGAELGFSGVFENSRGRSERKQKLNPRVGLVWWRGIRSTETPPGLAGEGDVPANSSFSLLKLASFCTRQRRLEKKNKSKE